MVADETGGPIIDYKRQLAAILLILGTALIARASEPATPADKPKRVAFTATVRTIDFLSRYEGKAILIDADPGYVFVVEIDERGSGDAAIPAGDRVAFAIHSPVQVFAKVGMAEAQIGRLVHFSVEKTIGAEGTRWRQLEARLKKRD